MSSQLILSTSKDRLNIFVSCTVFPAAINSRHKSRKSEFNISELNIYVLILLKSVFQYFLTVSHSRVTIEIVQSRSVIHLSIRITSCLFSSKLYNGSPPPVM